MACEAAEKDPTCAQDRDKAAARLMANAGARSFVSLLDADRLKDLRQQASAHHECYASAKVAAQPEKATPTAPPAAVEQPASAAEHPKNSGACISSAKYGPRQRVRSGADTPAAASMAESALQACRQHGKGAVRGCAEQQ